MTPVFSCGFECGQSNSHWATNSGTASFSTTTVRSGARSLRTNPTASLINVRATTGSTTRQVGRFYVHFATLPSADTGLIGSDDGLEVWFQQSDSKIYARAGSTNGATGVSVTTGTWYLIDFDFSVTGGNDTVDVQVDGTACGQASAAVTNTNQTNVTLGVLNTCTADIFFDDFILSHTAADYPIGAGFVHAFIPTSDGTHNVAGANDFERSGTGTDITNATTTAFQLIDDQPVEVTTAGPTDWINLIAPPNATDYVECIYGAASGSSTPTAAPRAVEVLVGYAASATGTCNIRLAVNDNGTTNDVFNGNPATTNTNVRYTTKQYATAPTGGAWTVSAGAGNFNNLRIRCLTNDAAPDPYFACTMVEAEFAPQQRPAFPMLNINQSVERASYI